MVMKSQFLHMQMIRLRDVCFNVLTILDYTGKIKQINVSQPVMMELLVIMIQEFVMMYAFLDRMLE